MLIGIGVGGYWLWNSYINPERPDEYVATSNGPFGMPPGVPSPENSGPFNSGPFSSGPGPFNSGPVTPEPVNPGFLNPQPVIPEPVNPGAANPGAANPGAVNPQPVNPEPVVPQLPGAVIGADRRIRYQWKPGDVHTYQLTIVAGDKNDQQHISGSCTYTVGAVPQQADENAEEGSGTGFVVAGNGYLGTCAHVVEGAQRIEVVLNGQSYAARIVSMDVRADVALLKIEADNLPVAPWMNSDEVQLAEAVRAIGYPLSDVLGTGVKITAGSVAGIVETKEEGRRIQVDAAINPGNSGGPIVTDSGRILGIASAKLSGSSVTAVGFAAPVNELGKLMNAQGLALPYGQNTEALTGPEIARRVTPSVAYIRVWGSSAGRVVSLNYSASISENHLVGAGGGGFGIGAIPRAPTHTSDHGTITVNTLGEILEYDGKEHLPFVMGPIGLFFIEQLDPHSETAWQHEIETSLRRSRSQEADSPLGPGFPRMPFGPRGFGSPNFRPPGFGGPGFGPPGFGGDVRQEEPEEVIPAIERVGYAVDRELDGRISISKTYEFVTTRNADRPEVRIQGKGTLVFDTRVGMPQSLEYKATFETNDEDGQSRIPITVSYLLRNPEEVKREREAARQQFEAARAQQERDANTPNPELVESLLQQVRDAQGGGQAGTPLQRLAEIAVVEDQRAVVMKAARNHLQNSNGFVRKAAAEVIARWASREEFDDLVAILASEDGLAFTAQKKAVQTLASFNDDRAYPHIISALNKPFVQDYAKTALIKVGSSIEPMILKALDEQTDDQARRSLIEILQAVGTEKSIGPLEVISKGPNFVLKFPAQSALDAIRARQ